LSKENNDWNDERIEQRVGNLLRAGVLLAAAVALIGGGVYLGQHGTRPGDYRTFHGEPEDLRRPAGIIGEALALRGRGLIQLGLLLLIATPVVRVILCVFAFGRQRDWIYVGIAAIVLGVLLFSLFFGHPEGGR
jgi:uncharacterized membrane protein